MNNDIEINNYDFIDSIFVLIGIEDNLLGSGSLSPSVRLKNRYIQLL